MSSRIASRIGACTLLLTPLLGGAQALLPPAPPPPAPLPRAVIDALCSRYDGKPAFERNGDVTKLSCAMVERLAQVGGTKVIPVYRAILGAARTLEGLRTVTLPRDLECGTFADVRVGDARHVRCTSELGQTVPFTFIASGDGTLRGVEIVYDHAAIYRIAMQRAVHRGALSAYFEPYVALQSDIQHAELETAREDGDRVERDGDRVTVFVAAPAAR